MESHDERIGIYGGTFSPIHSGHVHAAYAFLDAMNLDRLYVMPTALPPHKAEVAGADSNARFEMTRLAFENGIPALNGRLVVSDFEIKRRGRSYSVFTLKHFSKPGRELFMLVGTDMFLTLSSWYKAEEIFKLAQIVLMRREQNDSIGLKINAKKLEYIERYGAKIHIVDVSPLEISSTGLREKIRSGVSITGLVPDNIIKYIKENNLYR
jgi:nicotinate-nucleotide adenylyltransferase